MSILIDTGFVIQWHADKGSVGVRTRGHPTHDGRRTTVTKNQDARNTPRGALHHLDAHGPSAIPLTSRGLSELAARAMAPFFGRVLHATGAGDLSEEAKACMQSPLATALATALCDDKTDIADLMGRRSARSGRVGGGCVPRPSRAGGTLPRRVVGKRPPALHRCGHGDLPHPIDAAPHACGQGVPALLRRGTGRCSARYPANSTRSA
jgi:hypothetical protein